MLEYSKTEFEKLLDDPFELLINDTATYVDLEREVDEKNELNQIYTPAEVSCVGDIVLSEAVGEQAIIYISLRSRLGDGVGEASIARQSIYEEIYGKGSWRSDQYHHRKGSNPFEAHTLDFPQRHIVGDTDDFEEEIVEEYLKATEYFDRIDLYNK